MQWMWDYKICEWGGSYATVWECMNERIGIYGGCGIMVSARSLGLMPLYEECMSKCIGRYGGCGITESVSGFGSTLLYKQCMCELIVVYAW
jgi:hypothetical protein